MKIESRIGRSDHSAPQIYSFITDFRNFGNFLPEGKVSDWEAGVEECSFRVDPVGKTRLRIVEKEPGELVKIATVPEGSSYQFTLWIQLKQVAESDTRVKVTIEPQVNAMLLPMIKAPLKQLVDGLVEKIEGFRFP